MLIAEKGKGTFLNKKRFHVSNREKDHFFLIDGGKYCEEKALKIISTIWEDGNTVRILGSLGVHYAHVACGRIDGAISFNYDTFPEFAGKLLVEEAGGKFTDFNGGILNHKTVGIIASNGLLHDHIKKIIKN